MLCDRIMIRLSWNIFLWKYTSECTHIHTHTQISLGNGEKIKCSFITLTSEADIKSFSNNRPYFLNLLWLCCVVHHTVMARNRQGLFLLPWMRSLSPRSDNQDQASILFLNVFDNISIETKFQFTPGSYQNLFLY